MKLFKLFKRKPHTIWHTRHETPLYNGLRILVAYLNDDDNIRYTIATYMPSKKEWATQSKTLAKEPDRVIKWCYVSDIR